jgi:hypothetical protein
MWYHGQQSNSFLDMLARLSQAPVKRKVFISYHHGSRLIPGDQVWADKFRDLFCDEYDVMYDRSVNEPVNSSDLDYVNRVIREDYIFGSSITILLCGVNTWRRQCVDWEIYSTLYYKHALLGIALPGALVSSAGRVRVLDRYYINWLNGYAEWMHWPDSAVNLRGMIESALSKGRSHQPDNSALKMTRNIPLSEW